MAEGFYGRVAAYEAGLAGTGDALEQALRRNLYGTAQPTAAQVAAMAAYVRRQAAALSSQAVESLALGEAAFVQPEGEAA
jgi:cytochrome b pre-mRNA-processing protein 3